jgi:hypothetical protein
MKRRGGKVRMKRRKGVKNKVRTVPGVISNPQD